MIIQKYNTCFLNYFISLQTVLNYASENHPQILLLGHPINLRRSFKKLKNSLYSNTYILNQSHNAHDFLESSSIVQVTFYLPSVKLFWNRCNEVIGVIFDYSI